jgi:hypothetical protein
MNTFYQAVELLKSRLENNPLVNTVVFARTEEKDLYKKNIFPIAHINPRPSNWVNNQVNLFTFEVGVFEQRNIVKDPIETKFEGNDNQLDNMNTTYQVINDLVSYLERQDNEYQIEVQSVSAINPVIFKDFNLLDGWVVTITLSAPNNIDVCYE